MQCMVFQLAGVCMIAPVYFGLGWELVLFLIDTVSVVVVCMVI